MVVQVINKPFNLFYYHYMCNCLFIGVGKSMAIRAAATHAENILRKAGDDPHKPRVLLCSFTAKAANLIGKIILN